MHDRSTLSTGPSMSGIWKRESIERLGDLLVFGKPTKARIRRPINRPMLAHHPSGFGIGKADAKQIGQSRASAQARQRAIDPSTPAVLRLKHGARIPDSPYIRDACQYDIEKRARAADILRQPR